MLTQETREEDRPPVKTMPAMADKPWSVSELLNFIAM